MRSRYSAFVADDETYLRHSWDPAKAPREIHLSQGRTWTGLTIHDSAGGGAFDTEGTVSFTASYSEDGANSAQSENSLFSRYEGRWVYVGPA